MGWVEVELGRRIGSLADGSGAIDDDDDDDDVER